MAFRLFFFFLAVSGLCCCLDFSPVAASRGYSPRVVCRLLISAASLAVEHGLSVVRASVLTAHGLSGGGSQAPQLWRAGLVALRYVGSSQIRD